MTDKHDETTDVIEEATDGQPCVDTAASDDADAAKDAAPMDATESFAKLFVAWANRTLPGFIDHARAKHRDYLSRAKMSLLGVVLCVAICFFSTQFALGSGISMSLVFWCIDALSAVSAITFVVYALICIDIYVGERGQHTYLKKTPRFPLANVRDVLELMRDRDLHETVRLNDIVAKIAWEVTDVTEVTNLVTGKTQASVSLRALRYTDLDPVKMLVGVTPDIGTVVNVVPQWADLTVDDDGHIYIHADTYGTTVLDAKGTTILEHWSEKWT